MKGQRRLYALGGALLLSAVIVAPHGQRVTDSIVRSAYAETAPSSDPSITAVKRESAAKPESPKKKGNQKQVPTPIKSSPPAKSGPKKGEKAGSAPITAPSNTSKDSALKREEEALKKAEEELLKTERMALVAETAKAAGSIEKTKIPPSSTTNKVVTNPDTGVGTVVLAGSTGKPKVTAAKLSPPPANQPTTDDAGGEQQMDLNAIEAAARSNEPHHDSLSPPSKNPPQKRESVVERPAAPGGDSSRSAPLVMGVAARESALRDQIAQLEQLNATLETRLEEAKTKLMLAETQVERLSAIIEQRGDDDLRRFGGNSNRQPAAYAAPSRSRVAEMPSGMGENYGRQGSRVIAMPDGSGDAPIRQMNRQAPPPAVSNAPSLMPASRVDTDRDTPIATVVSKKALVRSGPSEAESVLSTLTTGAKVTVETQQGNWFRVIAPDGVRVWISAYDIAFGDTAAVPATGKKAPQPQPAVGAPQRPRPATGGAAGRGENEEDTVNQAMELLRQAGAE